MEYERLPDEPIGPLVDVSLDYEDLHDFFLGEHRPLFVFFADRLLAVEFPFDGRIVLHLFEHRLENLLSERRGRELPTQRA
jgi:hypothetical protein